MNLEIEQYLEKYPEKIVQLFMRIRDVIFSIEGIAVDMEVLKTAFRDTLA